MTIIKSLKSYLKPYIQNLLYHLFGLHLVNQKYRNINSKYNFIKKIIYPINEKLVILDVGQNVGKMTDFFLKILFEKKINIYEIHCFEPDAQLFNLLKKKYSQNNKIFLNNIALSNYNNVGEKDFFLYENSQKNSLNKINKIIKYVDKTKVKVETLDNYSIQNNLKTINFLKIDAEGEEPNILQGAKNLIANNQIKFIYTELTTGNYYSDKLLKIADIENTLNKNYLLMGIDTMNVNSEIIFADKNKSITIGLIYENLLV